MTGRVGKVSEQVRKSVEAVLSRRRTGARPPAAFTLAVGFAAGVLVAALAIPAGDSETTVAGGAVGQPGEAPVGGPVVDGGDGPGLPAGAGGAGPGGAAQAGASAAAVAGTDGGTTQGTTGRGGTSGGGGDTGGGDVRGVSGDTVRLGIGVLDIGALSHLGPSFDNGDGEEHMKAWLEGVRRDGLLPVHGRDLEFTYRRYAPAGIDPGSQRSACVGFIDEDEVFAVLAGSNYQEGAECVAREFGTPLITSDGVEEEAYQRSHPNLFTFMMSETRLLKNWIHWAHHGGHFDGETLGLYYGTDARQQRLVKNAIKPQLAALGYELAAEHTTSQPLGGPQDAVAVQKFDTAGVTVAMLLTSKAGFQQQAQARGYQPTYIESDFLSGTTNTATSTYPEDQWDGTLGMTGMRYGEWKAGMPQSERARKCVEYYEEYSGNRIDPNEREAEWIGMNKLCDSGWAVLAALEHAGRDLTPQSFIAGLESLTDFELGVHLDVTFAGDRHHGTNVQRTVRWTRDCRCWKALGSMGPLWVR